MFRKVCILMAMLAILSPPANSDAAWFGDFSSQREWKSGTVRNVAVSGPYVLDVGESITAVFLEYTITGSSVLARAQGSVNGGTRTWQAAVGDFALVKYRVRIDVRKNGSNRSFYSNWTTWTGR